jgi:hypothetical protein
MSELTKQGRYSCYTSAAGHILGDIGELQAKIHVQQDFYAINSVLHISLKNDKV